MTDLKEFGAEMATKMSQAWELARQSVGKAQKRQKAFYDKKAREPNFTTGERVFLLKPSETTGASRKFARPFHGPYRITSVEANNACVRRVDRPQDEPILVALQRLRRCPDEVGDEFWPPDSQKKRGRPKTVRVSGVDEEDAVEPSTTPPTPALPEAGETSSSTTSTEPPNKGKYTGVLRRHLRTADAMPGM